MTLLNQKCRRSAFWGHTQTLIQINGIYLHLRSGSVQFTFSILVTFFLIICLSLYIHPVLVPMIVLKLGVAPSCTKSFVVVVQISHTSPTPHVLGDTAHSFTHSFSVLNTMTDCCWESSSTFNSQELCVPLALQTQIWQHMFYFIYNEQYLIIKWCC